MKENILYLQGYNISVNGKLYNIENFYNSYKNSKNIIIKFTNLIEYLNSFNSHIIKYNVNDYFILFNGKIISNDIELKYISKNENNINNYIQKHIQKHIKTHVYINNFDIISKQKGGQGSGFVGIIMGVIKIGEFFLSAGDVVVWLLKFILWFVEFLMWFMFDLLDPQNVFTDFFGTLRMIVYSLANLVFTLTLSIAKMGFNTIAGWMQGFWGWDMSNLTKNDKNSPYFQNLNKNKVQKIYYTNSNTVPFSIILGTILCPPMGVFMDLGITGWLNVVICGVLTLLFYLPGLCYALLIIYS
jgi:uncharacterized membrane protein YqaE (UPF0057 family)